MMRRSAAVGVFALTALFFFVPREAAGQDARAFISTLGTQAIQVLGPSVSPAQRLARFRELFRNDFDVPGIGQFVLAKKATFKQDLKREEMSLAEKKFVDGIGRFGFFARGVTFTLVGWFVFQAGLHRDPTRVRGFSGAFTFLLSQPYGHLLLGVVALGFVALGLHSFACARWMRLLGSRG